MMYKMYSSNPVWLPKVPDKLQVMEEFLTHHIQVMSNLFFVALCCHAWLNIMLNVQCPTSDPRSLDVLCVVSHLVSTRLKLQRIMWGHVN
jgi:hypothetical protein